MPSCLLDLRQKRFEFLRFKIELGFSLAVWPRVNEIPTGALRQLMGDRNLHFPSMSWTRAASAVIVMVSAVGLVTAEAGKVHLVKNGTAHLHLHGRCIV